LNIASSSGVSIKAVTDTSVISAGSAARALAATFFTKSSHRISAGWALLKRAVSSTETSITDASCGGFVIKSIIFKTSGRALQICRGIYYDTFNDSLKKFATTTAVAVIWALAARAIFTGKSFLAFALTSITVASTYTCAFNNLVVIIVCVWYSKYSRCGRASFFTAIRGGPIIYILVTFHAKKACACILSGTSGIITKSV
jgi:hypothetical protein